jgi:tetratricopeptide (TPR) repeat protein
MPWRTVLCGALAGAVGLTCASREAEPPGPPPPTVEATTSSSAAAHEPPEATLPLSPAGFAPGLVRRVGTGPLDGSTLAGDDQLCATCHADAVQQWRSSAHAFASFDNPIYRVSVDAFRNEQGNEASRFCGACHDVALLLDGALDHEVSDDDPRARGGVSCLSCHSVESASLDGNGSYSLSREAAVLPDPDDPVSVAAHKKRMRPAPLGKLELCASCHRAFLGPETGNGHHMAGTDDVAPWLRSAYAGSHLDRIDPGVGERGCVDCHMEREAAELGDVSARDGTIRSHRFVGGHSWLANMRGDDDQVERVRRQLRRAASIEVAAVRGPDGVPHFDLATASLEPGAALEFDVVVHNRGVGHHFPGGTRDAQDVWIEFEVLGADGTALARAGAEHAAGRSDPSAHRLHSAVVDDSGAPQRAREVHRFRALAYDRTVAPRDAAVVRYRWQLPERLRRHLPLRLVARLKHRSRNAELQRAACAAWRRRGAPGSLDPCAPQPVTELARDEQALGAADKRPADAAPRDAMAPDRPSGELARARLLRHGRGWRHALQEQVDRARPALELAYVRARKHGDEPAQAAALVELARVAARQGRVDEVEQRLDAAATMVPGHPALAYVRGLANARVWRFEPASRWLQLAAAGAPHDDRAWVELAMAQGSLERSRAALSSARRGLALVPRQPDLLRVQALALRDLGAPAAVLEPAVAAFLRHRARDDGPAMLSRCSDRSYRCALERNPVHAHELVPVDDRPPRATDPATAGSTPERADGGPARARKRR